MGLADSCKCDSHSHLARSQRNTCRTSSWGTVCWALAQQLNTRMSHSPHLSPCGHMDKDWHTWEQGMVAMEWLGKAALSQAALAQRLQTMHAYQWLFIWQTTINCINCIAAYFTKHDLPTHSASRVVQGNDVHGISLHTEPNAQLVYYTVRWYHSNK